LKWDKLPKPWTKEQCRRRYVEGGDNIGIRGLAATAGQPKGTLEEWVKRESWVEQRRQYQDRLTTATQTRTVEKVSEKLSDDLSEVAIANYEKHRLARDYAARIFEIKSNLLTEIESLPLAEKEASLAKHHSGSEMNYWSQVLKRSTDAIAQGTGLNYYVEINAAAGRLEKEGYEIVDPSSEQQEP
jgi:hypothetical protein